MNDVYYIVYSTPTQLIPQYYKGRHPLIPDVLDKLISDLATKYSLKTGTLLPKDAFQILNVIKLPDDIAKELENSKFVS
jgi:hypothetical protein